MRVDISVWEFNQLYIQTIAKMSQYEPTELLSLEASLNNTPDTIQTIFSVNKRQCGGCLLLICCHTRLKLKNNLLYSKNYLFC